MVGSALMVAGACNAQTTPPPGELTPCRVQGWAQELRCGSLQRPLNPAEPQGARITVHYLVVPAKARNKRSDPVLFLPGGPGQSATQLAPQIIPLLGGINNRRDLVFIDQRGTGRSAPLQCPETQGSLQEALDTESSLRALDQCRTALEALPHGDLRHYTTLHAVDDIEAVRQALGVAQWNVIGVSYGTRVALEMLRTTPQAVRRTVLDGVAPADMVLPATMGVDAAAALEQVFARCAADADCDRRFPALRQRWTALLARLPQTVEVRHPDTGIPHALRITRTQVEQWIRPALYAPALTAVVPAALDAALAGRWEGLVGLTTGLGLKGPARLAEGMHFSVICAEDGPRLPAADGRDAAPAVDLYRRACSRWPVAPLPEAFYQIPTARTPVLVLSGGLDPVTPARHGERVARQLGDKAQHAIAPHLGHGVLRAPCLREPLLRFLQAESEAEAQILPLPCLERMPPARAFLPPLPPTVKAPT